MSSRLLAYFSVEILDEVHTDSIWQFSRQDSEHNQKTMFLSHAFWTMNEQDALILLIQDDLKWMNTHDR